MYRLVYRQKISVTTCELNYWISPPSTQSRSPMSYGIGAGNCKTISNFKKYYVSSYGTVNGVANMKAEIY